MKLELHKAYKTRGGWKAVVVNQFDDDNFLVWHEEDGDVRPHGQASGKTHTDYDYDIISEWHEPRQWQVWVEVEEFIGGDIGFGVFTEQPRRLGATKAIAGPFTITEGEGLDNA